MLYGNLRVRSYFENIAKKNRLAHAYLFYGPDGVGKRSYAVELAQAILCPDAGEGAHVSDECRACFAVAAGSYPTVYFIRPEGDGGRPLISVTAIRALRRALTLKAFVGEKRVVIVDGAEYMNREAANAFLKTLEEPYPGIHFFMIVASLAALPETIISRSERVRFTLLSDADVVSVLKGRGATEKQAMSVAKYSFGRPAWAARYYEDEKLLAAAEVSVKDVRSLVSPYLSMRMKVAAGFPTDAQEAALSLQRWILALGDVLKKQVRDGDDKAVITARFLSDCFRLASTIKNTNANPRLALESIVFSPIPQYN